MALRLLEGATRINLVGDKEELEILASKMVYRPDRFFLNPRYQLFKKTGGKEGWDGYKPQLYLKWSAKNPGSKVGICGRGYLDDILRLCEEHGIQIDVKSRLPSPFADITDDDLPDDLVTAPFKPDENQRRLVLDWLRRGVALHVAAVNSGKTLIFCMAAAMILRHKPDARILYLVPGERLAAQVSKEARNFLPDVAIGRYGGAAKGGRDKDAQMIVATNQILSKHFDQLQREGWFNSFYAVFFDEAHHLTGKTLQAVADATGHALFRLGATDGAKEYSGERYHAIKSVLGPVRERIAMSVLIDSGRSAKPEIIVVREPAWRGKMDHLGPVAEPNTPAWCYIGDEWHKATYLGPAPERDDSGDLIKNKSGTIVAATGVHLMKTESYGEIEVPSRWCLLQRTNDAAIIKFNDRNKRIVDWTKYFSGQGKQTLVIATRTLHILILHGLLERAGVDVRVLYSEHSPKERDETFEWFKETPGTVLVSSVVKEGVSINAIRAGVVADYVRDLDYARQLIGRLMRRKEDDNRAEIVWFQEEQHRGLLKGSVALLNDIQKIDGMTFFRCRTPEEYDKLRSEPEQGFLDV